MKLQTLAICTLSILASSLVSHVHASKIPEHVAVNMRSAFVTTCTSKHLELLGPKADPADVMASCYCYINHLIDNTTYEHLLQMWNAGSDWPQYMQDEANARCFK